MVIILDTRGTARQQRKGEKGCRREDSCATCLKSIDVYLAIFEVVICSMGEGTKKY